MVWLPFLLFGIAVAAIYYFQIQRRVARRRAIATLARSVGFEYWHDGTSDITGMAFNLFKQGKGRKAQNVISGVHNAFPLKVFDYEYYVDSNNSRDYRRFTSAVLTIPAACPALRLTNETMLSRLGDRLGGNDIELEYDDFNRRFSVSSKDQKFAFSLLDGQMMQWLLESDGFERVEIVGPWVMIVRKQLAPAEWLDLGTWLDAFRKRIPSVVYSTFPRS